MDHATITELAEQEEPGCEGVNFLPYLTGERTPNWPSSYGALTGLRAGHIRPGLIYRAALEGATYSLLNGMPSADMTAGLVALCLPRRCHAAFWLALYIDASSALRFWYIDKKVARLFYLPVWSAIPAWMLPLCTSSMLCHVLPCHPCITCRHA